jgi:hypothetical protein
MMRQLVNLVFCCTDREALNLAIFLGETFTLLERWRVRTQLLDWTIYPSSIAAMQAHHHQAACTSLFVTTPASCHFSSP